MDKDDKTSRAHTAELTLPTCELVAIGSEILLGQINDTNTAYLAKELSQIGITVEYRTVVGDRLEQIRDVIKAAVDRCDLVITTGGLGPTLDDITRDAVAAAGEVQLEFREELMAQIKEIFLRYGFKMSENNRRQAFVPKGSYSVSNRAGTAPAFITEMHGKPVISIPGVPREMKVLMKEKIIPWLKKRYHLTSQALTYQILKVIGIGESVVDTIIGDLIVPGSNPEVGLMASPGEITVRIAAKAEDRQSAEKVIGPVREEMVRRLGNSIYTYDNRTIQEVVESLLVKANLQVALLETFTGGLIASAMSSIPSQMTRRCIIFNRRDMLDQDEDENVSGVDTEKALYMASKISKDYSADMGLAVLGFPKEVKDHMELEGFSAAVLGDSFKCLSWKSGGDLKRIQRLGTLTGLNTLRLLLLEKACSKD